MRIALIVEGRTETAFLPHLRSFLRPMIQSMPRIDPLPYDGPIPKQERLKRIVANLLNSSAPADHVIALTDVYTGTNPPEFTSADDAKRKMRQWVGPEPRFHAHAAQYDFEAWLLPYWPTIQRLANHNTTAPAGAPESVNHNRPPAHRLKELFEVGKCRGSYVKPRDAGRILRENHLGIAVAQCLELKSFVNTILTLSGETSIP